MKISFLLNSVTGQDWGMENIEAGEGDWDKGEGKGSEEILVSMLGHDVFCLGWK